MSNIHDALEQACKEKTCSAVSSQLALEAQVTRGLSLSDEMSKLHRQIELLLANSSYKVIQFIGCGPRVGVSTIMREFATAAVNRHGKSVLILDPAYQDPERRININLTCEYAWRDMLEKGEFPDKAFFRFGDSQLYFAPISVQASLVPPFKDIAMTASLWEKLRDKFDLILVDSSSDASDLELLDPSRHIDGTILVLEADRTRRQTAEALKKKVTANGCSILGVIFNKRKYYIPAFIYKIIYRS